MRGQGLEPEPADQAHGLIPAGTEIELIARGKAAQAVITGDGTIKVGEKVYATPSAAGSSVVGNSIDGWVVWRVPSLGNRSLADLRSELLELRASQESS